MDSENSEKQSRSSIEKVDVNTSQEYIHSGIKELDVTFTLAEQHAKDREYTPEENRRLRNKLDWHLLPLLCYIYMGECFCLSCTERVSDGFGSVQLIDK